MTRFVSTRGGISPVNFDQAVLQGFAADGGLFVPESIPQVTHEQFEKWAELSFPDLAYELLSLFIDRSIIPAKDLKKLIDDMEGTIVCRSNNTSGTEFQILLPKTPAK